MHIALLGDSIFDNAAYVGREPDVATHLRRIAPGASVTLLAVDGATASGVPRQAARVADDVTHVVVSVGGNDALGSVDLLDRPITSTGRTLDLFGERAATFEKDYRAAIDAVAALKRDTTICTIYNGNLPGIEGKRAPLALCFFNDVIVRVALEHGFRIIDLRAVCREPADYANPIEPSGRGGEKIARAIARVIAKR